jgi:hypothetical protein
LHNIYLVIKGIEAEKRFCIYILVLIIKSLRGLVSKNVKIHQFRF